MLCKSCGAKLNDDSIVCSQCHEDNKSSFELFCNNGELLLGILSGSFSGTDLSKPVSSESPRDGFRASGLRGTSSSSGEKGAFIISSPETEQRKTRTADPEEHPRGRFKPLTPGKTGDLTSGRLKERSGKNRKSALPEAVFATPEGENGKAGEDDVSKLKVSPTLNRIGRYHHPKAPDDAGLSFPPSADKESPKTVYNGDLRPPEDSSGGGWPVFILLSVVLAAGAGLLYYTEEGRKILYSYVLTEPHPIAKDLPPSREYSKNPGNTGTLNARNHGRRSGRHNRKEPPPETKPAYPEKPVIAVVPPDSAPGSLKDNAKLGQDSGTGKTDKPNKPAGEAISSVKAPRPIISVPAEISSEKTEIAVISAVQVTAGTLGESSPPVIAPRPIISKPAEFPEDKTEIAVSGSAIPDTAGSKGETASPVTVPRPIISTPPEAAPEKTTDTATRSGVPDIGEITGETASPVTAPRPIIGTPPEAAPEKTTDTAARSGVPDIGEIMGETASQVTAPRPIISTPAEVSQDKTETVFSTAAPDIPVVVPDKHSAESPSVPQKTQENDNTIESSSKKTTNKRSGTSPTGSSSQKNAGSTAVQSRKASGASSANTGKKSNRPNNPRRNPRQKNGGKKK